MLFKKRSKYYNHVHELKNNYNQNFFFYIHNPCNTLCLIPVIIKKGYVTTINPEDQCCAVLIITPHSMYFLKNNDKPYLLCFIRFGKASDNECLI